MFYSKNRKYQFGRYFQVSFLSESIPETASLLPLVLIIAVADVIYLNFLFQN